MSASKAQLQVRLKAPGGPPAHVDHFAADNLPPRTAWPEIDYSRLPELAALPDRINCATEILDRGAAEHGSNAAVLDDKMSWNYSELLAKANRIAHVLVDDLGVQPGNRVLLHSGNNPMYAACWFAVMKVGAIAVASMPLLRARELLYMADFAQIRVALCDAVLADELYQAAGDATHRQGFSTPSDGLYRRPKRQLSMAFGTSSRTPPDAPHRHDARS